uniref:Uncharacterized protein n=1 Tax=Coturnix japonica TaxID=93934 RepID=A0A8C2UBH7_COTJA
WRSQRSSPGHLCSCLLLTVLLLLLNNVFIFLLISQVTRVDCDSSLDFLLCYFHAIIKNLKELFGFLIFC